MLSIIITYILNSWKLRNFSECEFFDRSINVGKCGTVMDFWSTSHFYRFTRSLIGESEQHSPVSRESGEEDLGAAGLLRGAYSAGPVSQTCYWSKRRKLHCPNSGPHFSSYRTYTKDAFLYREKNSAPVVMLYCENFYSSHVRHTWSWHNFPSVIETPCDTGHNRLPSWNKFYALFVSGCNPLRHRY